MYYLKKDIMPELYWNGLLKWVQHNDNVETCLFFAVVSPHACVTRVIVAGPHACVTRVIVAGPHACVKGLL